MKNAGYVILGLCLCAGCAESLSAGNEPLVALEASRGHVVDVAHIYFNIMTGERVVTLMGDGQTAGADTETSGPIWSSSVRNQCTEAGYTTEWFFDIGDSSCSGTSCADNTLLDFGDIAMDTVVDCVQVSWITDLEDVDEDSDGVGDGIAGFGGLWTYWDADNGRAENRSTRQALISLLLVDLPGNIFPPDDGMLSRYSADIDLAGSFGDSMTFEIGDSDGDPQGAAFHNANIANEDRDFDGLPDSDLDGDGLFDWAWQVEFFLPGTMDFDGDGELDGDFVGSYFTMAVGLGAPAGEAVDNGDGTWDWNIDTSILDAGTGAEDAFAIYRFGVHAGFYWFGGFNCDPDQPWGYTPSAMFEHRLFGPANPWGVCRADLNGDGVLNFFDISAFLGLFDAEDPLADFDRSGTFNFFDISEFLAEFGTGCP